MTDHSMHIGEININGGQQSIGGTNVHFTQYCPPAPELGPRVAAELAKLRQAYSPGSDQARQVEVVEQAVREPSAESRKRADGALTWLRDNAGGMGAAVGALITVFSQYWPA